jgi:succinate-semialdehyde dehydrogenase/glutarate-semialdehyde dehydrogenase
MSVETPDVPSAAVRYAGRDTRLFIAGEWREGAGWLDVLDPATEERAGGVALATAADVDDAVSAAGAAFPAWARTPGHERGAVLVRAAALLESRADVVVHGLMREAGKTRTDAEGEHRRAVETLRWNGEEAGRIEGGSLDGMARDGRRSLIPTPLGVVAAFTAWNFPAVLAARKLGAALAAGCTVVLKASELAPTAAGEVVRALADAGLPAGALNLVFGEPREVAGRLLGAREVRAVTFTGSTAVGRQIAALAANDLKRCVLELGGHAPVIVADDADIGLALRSIVPAKFGSAGQSCLAPSRLFVHESCHEAFVSGLAEAARSLRVGIPEVDPDAQMGPVISRQRLAALERLTEDAAARGARIVCGGARVGECGFFWAPTVIVGVPDEADLMREEPFGPIAAVASFRTLEEAIRRANRTDYAFGGYVFTRSLHTRDTAVRDLRASNIGINQMAPSLPDAPLGGMHDSGYGYEGGSGGIRAFQHLRLVSETTPQ